ncbi:hypothetical protein E8E12_004919 [Didymella heteroderae]|uniref:Uncharacterized protein n=1 Tax=Didymella heteroderae TaxID=1769908 RepID=A0A9P4WQR4_9PLEO|nr:hypothetical protein E8E12_004919 [Didymella heteroderae]
MKASLFTLLAAFAAGAITSPIPASDTKAPAKVIKMARSVFERSTLAKYDRLVRSEQAKRNDPIADSVNYILVLQKDSTETPDAYQDEVDAANPADILGKRADPIADSVNYILVLQKDSNETPDAYQDEVDAADPAEILGKRADPIADSVNYILVLQKDSTETPDAYQDEIDAANPADVLG